MICRGLAGLMLALAATAAAQEPAPRDTAAAAADSISRDSSDSVRTVPILPEAPPRGPLPWGRRLVFDQEALQLAGVLTLSDLLREVPGVYVMRGGFFGQAEPVMYAGRSGVSPALEIYWDGLALDPLGRDSVWLDPARVPLGLAERVEILIEPSRIRVDVTSLEQRLVPARSQIRVVTGDDDIAEYRAVFEKRWPAGTGVTAAADYHNIERTGLNQGAFSQSTVWLKGQWIPRPTAGVSYQVLSTEVSRDGSTLLPTRTPRRTDWLLHLFARQYPAADGRGWSVDGWLGSQSVAGDSGLGEGTARQAALRLGYTHHLGGGEIELRARDALTPWEVTARTRLRPLNRLLLTADARRSWHDVGGGGGAGGERRGSVLHASAALGLVAGLSIRGDVTRFEALQAPARTGDTLQRATDLAGAVRWDHPLASLEVGVARRDPWQPIAYPDFAALVATQNPAVPTHVFTAAGTLRPTSYLLLAGWYHDPYRAGADFEPPKHFRGSAVFQSKFWRKYRSGAFNLRAEVAVELWSRGIAGRDPLGNQLALGGATFVETNLQIQIVGATLFYMIRNANVMRAGYLPGLPYPRNQRVWGVRWLFSN